MDNLTTIMGEQPAAETIYLFRKMMGTQAHASADEHIFHSDSWHIKKTSEDIELMQRSLDNVLAMVAKVVKSQTSDDISSGKGQKNAPINKIPEPPPTSVGKNKTKVVPLMSNGDDAVEETKKSVRF